MKIAIDISQIVYEGTGVANYTKELVRALLAIDKKNEYILFGVSLRKLDNLYEYFNTVKDLSDNVQAKFIQVPQTFSNFLWNNLHIFSVNKIIGEVDIFHSSDWVQPPVRAKRVTTIHDLVVYKYPDTSHPQIIATHKKRLEWVKNECDAVIADSQATKNDIREILHIEEGKILVIHLGVDAKFRKSTPDQIRQIKEKYRLPDQFILSLGTNEPRKNIKRLLEAKKKMNISIPLILAGKYGWGDEIDHQDNVRSLGFVPVADLSHLYSAATVFVFPSLYEGFGLPILEAMACGVPVVTTNRGSLKEVVQDAAVLCDPEQIESIVSAIERVVGNTSLQKDLSKKGIEHIKKFTWVETAKKTLSVYNSQV